MITILHCEHRLYGHMHRRESIVKIHIVQKGDTLWKIAKKYGVDFEELKMLNSQLSNTDMIMPGMKIKVPTTGGSIKKEAPKMETIKEMPKKEMPIVKEQPITIPKKEMPKKEMPKKEMPKEKPYTPKMPTPIIPEIDVHNYYSMNMTNIDVDVDVEETNIMPPKPTVVMPPVKQPVVEPVQQEPCPPIIPYQPYCYEVSPMMPGSGFPPGVCPPTVPVAQMPETYNSLPGVAHTDHMHWEESSSYAGHQYGGHSHAGMAQQPPADYYQQPLVQYGQMPVGMNYMGGNQEESSSDVMGVNYAPHVTPQVSYQLPFKEDCGCNGPSMHQSTYAAPETFQAEGTMYPGMGGYPMSGQNLGMNPEMGGYPMAGDYNTGMPMGMMQPGMNPEMGGYPMAGPYNQPYPMNPTSMQSPYPQGVAGNTPLPYPVENEVGVPGYNSGMPFEASLQQPITPEMSQPFMGPGGNAPVYTPPFNSNMGQPPFMNPYGANQGTPFGMPRYQEDESSDI